MLKNFLHMTKCTEPTGIVHVGAHTGQEILEYKDYTPAVIVWIEADPEVFPRLYQNVTQNWGMTETEQWCLNALVSDTNGDTLDFHLTGDKSQSSSMFPPTELHTRFFPKATPTGQVLQLESRTLSTLLADLSLEPTQIDYLVLDTQGAELKCLGGLGRYIQNLRYLTVEVSTVEYYEGGAQLPELDAYLEARGFLRVSGIPRWKHGDALYLRTSTDGRAADRVLTAVENHQDGEVRDFVNSFIGRGNDVIEDEHFDFASWDEELFQVYERYEAVLGLATSYDVCVAMARFAYDRNMGRSLTAFLKPLRCL